jgi:hypothetical protein
LNFSATHTVATTATTGGSAAESSKGATQRARAALTGQRDTTKERKISPTTSRQTEKRQEQQLFEFEF